jgi:hypothetical protein
MPIALAVVTALGFASCGDGEPGREERNPNVGGRPSLTTYLGTADDLPRMVLQLEDVPDGFSRTDRNGEIAFTGEAGIQANLIAFLQTGKGYRGQVWFSEFELPSEEATPPGILCITSFALVAESSEVAELGLFNFVELIGTSVDEPVIHEGDVEIELLDVSAFPGVAWRFRSPAEDLCEGWQHERTEGYIFSFVNSNAAGTVFVSSAEDAGDLDSAVALALKQVDRVEAVLAGDS